MFPKFRNIALSAIGLLALGMPPATALNVGVTPSRFELEINSKNTRSQSIRLLNLSSKPVEIKAFVRSWVMSQDNKLQDVAPTAESLDQWIVFTPSRFIIPARGAQTIRFAIRPKTQPKPGEHRAVLYLQEVSPKNQVDPKTKMRVISQIGVVIYGYVGDVKRTGVLNSVAVDTKKKTQNAVFDVSNQGNAYVRLNGQYAIWPAAKYPGSEATKPIANVDKPNAKLPENVVDAGYLPFSPVLPNNRRQLQLPITKNLPPGNYVLDINGDLSGVAINKGIPFTVPVANTIEAQVKPAVRNLRNSLRSK
ncbi:fimbrial biogenesis chaperone [Halotia branconii]|uniref:Fimbria/pilus periplasmic chaperone n=1 Tax=Halotia branconii CENA392 TaxID=1539056 RepID=A0AAJ6PA10_9CYAN|nr:fimbria/pilus periplasmic chaperone [Halotia branconii]WGV26384.1 fimbria/pilus periplasmic chaperone [Halotia branconii CENA392]